MARFRRYTKLNSIANTNSSNIILTAHHFDDQIETLIMKDKTKSDWVSYIGIRDKYGKISRPMLRFKKRQISIRRLLQPQGPSSRNISPLRNG